MKLLQGMKLATRAEETHRKVDAEFEWCGILKQM